ncbi:MAG TPA: 5-formyltetrahydrofolate cyclo-ligase [Beijerinckiaceae bacterium]|nr:5-formyltetrahydrofolate cyclo-ligase [Beijerinckiaceae bacterium]
MTDLASKTALRRHALARRDLIEPAEAHAAAEEIVERALEIVGKLAPAGAVVSAYWPIRSEISTRPLLEALAQAGYRIALPVMTAAAKPLHFRLWAPGEELAKGALGLFEPLPDAAMVEPELMFTPLACFDAKGHRVGYGGGNFDATLAAHRGQRKVPAVGLAFADQEVDSIPHEAHDQRLDFVITETQVFECGASG